jgi:hypothetical protein
MDFDEFEERRHLVHVGLLLTMSCPTLRNSGEPGWVGPTARLALFERIETSREVRMIERGLFEPQF